MNKQIKYEAVFGDQDLFIPAPSDAIVVRYGKDFYNYESEVTSTTGKLRDNPIVAMRRIVEEAPEPKRWTLADKEAGLLPCVGGEVSDMDGDVCRVIGVNHGGETVAVQYGVGSIKVFTLGDIAPIETPEERAKREEDEFVDSNIVGVEFKDNSDLSFYRKGLRAAYRKLKMPEVL